MRWGAGGGGWVSRGNRFPFCVFRFVRVGFPGKQFRAWPNSVSNLPLATFRTVKLSRVNTRALFLIAGSKHWGRPSFRKPELRQGQAAGLLLDGLPLDEKWVVRHIRWQPLTRQR